MSAAATGVWAYAITEQDRLNGPDGEIDLSWLSGIGEAEVRTITCAGLTVLASDVSLAEFGDAALRENLENLDWLNEVARLHHYVIDAAARLVPLLPVRLATVYLGDAAARAALTEHHDQLLGALRRVGGRVEWGVKAYAAAGGDEDARVPAARGPAGTHAEASAGGTHAEASAGGTADGGPGSGAGLAYLKRRRDKLAAERDARTAAVQGARNLHAGLAGQAAAAVVRPPQSAQLSGVRQPMLLNAAYLLDAGDGHDFTAAVAAEATAHPELRIELTGPWPPYSFAGDADDDWH